MDSIAQNRALVETLRRLGLLEPRRQPEITALAGGVSSDIMRVDTGTRSLCVKRALPKLKVQADWRAPVERNHWEVEWMRIVRAIEAAAVPAILGEDQAAGIFAMEYLAPSRYPVWKQQLADGIIELDMASAVGARLANIHAATARDVSLREKFATDHIFIPIRIEPYLLATANAHPDLAAHLHALAHATTLTRLSLVHGDVSPKNILSGPDGPVFLDAECAWYGDPAFDLAFCLNHLLLKCLWRPQWSQRYLEAFQALCETYLARVNWEARRCMEQRSARLLPGLLLARVDGKSPAEYLTQSWQKTLARSVARALLLDPVPALGEIQATWAHALKDKE